MSKFKEGDFVMRNWLWSASSKDGAESPEDFPRGKVVICGNNGEYIIEWEKNGYKEWYTESDIQKYEPPKKKEVIYLFPIDRALTSEEIVKLGEFHDKNKKVISEDKVWKDRLMNGE